MAARTSPASPRRAGLHRHGRRRRDVSAPGARSVRRAPRRGRRPRDGLALRGDDPRRGDAVAEPARRQPDPDRAPQRPLRREDLRRALRHAGRSSRRAGDPRPPLDRDGVRLRDGLQGVPAGSQRERDPDRLLPARRRVEAQPFRRRVATRQVHAALQPELAVLRPRACAARSGARRSDRAGGRPGDAPRSYVADPHALRVHSRGPARDTDRSAGNLRAGIRCLAPRGNGPARRVGEGTP